MRELAEALRDKAVQRGVDFMDVRLAEDEGTRIARQDGKADKLYQGKSGGLGIRVLLDGVWGFATGSTIRRDEAFDCLELAIEMARASQARVGQRVELPSIQPVVDQVSTRIEKDPRTVPLVEKMQMLGQYEQAAIDCAPDKMANTVVNYLDGVRREFLCNTAGTFIESHTVRTRLAGMIVVREGSLHQRNFQSRATTGGYEAIEQLTPADITVKAAQTALSLLSADRAPSGKFPVIFHPTTAGLLIHEALGHNAEADLVLGGKSILEGKLGTQIASDQITVIDDATLEGQWGSYLYDSEGIPGTRRVLVENGILKNFMHSLQTAAAYQSEPNGCARAQDPSHRPIVRMSNTFVSPGKIPFEEMVKEIDLGVLVKGGQWGHVFSEKGQYTCNVSEGWIIRNGEIQEHIRDVSIAGMILETLTNVDAVSQEFEMDISGGTCGKDGQGMPVGSGGPYIRVKELVVGGQEMLLA